MLEEVSNFMNKAQQALMKGKEPQKFQTLQTKMYRSLYRDLGVVSWILSLDQGANTVASTVG